MLREAAAGSFSQSSLAGRAATFAFRRNAYAIDKTSIASPQYETPHPRPLLLVSAKLEPAELGSDFFGFLTFSSHR